MLKKAYNFFYLNISKKINSYAKIKPFYIYIFVIFAKNDSEIKLIDGQQC